MLYQNVKDIPVAIGTRKQLLTNERPLIFKTSNNSSFVSLFTMLEPIALG